MQRRLVMSLLAQSSFSKQLTAVREANSLLKRSVELRSIDGGASIKVCSLRPAASLTTACPPIRCLRGDKPSNDGQLHVLRNPSALSRPCPFLSCACWPELRHCTMHAGQRRLAAGE